MFILFKVPDRPVSKGKQKKLQTEQHLVPSRLYSL
jgi:hypothetical protein